MKQVAPETKQHVVQTLRRLVYQNFKLTRKGQMYQSNDVTIQRIDSLPVFKFTTPRGQYYAYKLQNGKLVHEGDWTVTTHPPLLQAPLHYDTQRESPIPVSKQKIKPQVKIMPSLPSYTGGPTFEEHERKIAAQYGRKHIGFPCDVAQDLPLSERPKHIKSCAECQRLLKKLDDVAYKK